MDKSSTRIAACSFLPLILIGSGCVRTPEQKASRFLQQGKEHFQKKDYVRAVLDFKNAAQAKPSDAEAYYQLGNTYLAMGNMRAGIDALRRATQLNPKHAA